VSGYDRKVFIPERRRIGGGNPSRRRRNVRRNAGDGEQREREREREAAGSIRFSNLGGRLYLNSGTGRWFRAPAMARLISNRIRWYPPISHTLRAAASSPSPSFASNDRQGDWTAETTIARIRTLRLAACRREPAFLVYERRSLVCRTLGFDFSRFGKSRRVHLEISSSDRVAAN